MINTASIIEAVYYLLVKLGPKTKLQLLKLIFLADKYHLLHYGRTVTGDEYFVMQYGPVGSTVKDVLEFDDFSLDENELALAQKYFETHDDKTRKAKSSAPHPEDLDYLSESDIEALDYVIAGYGNMEAFKLVDFTHKYPEWQQYREMFERGETRRERLSTLELISIIPDDTMGYTEEQLETAREIATGKAG